MIHSYTVTGMTCSSCENKVQQLLSAVPHVQKVEVNKETGEASMTTDTHIEIETFQQALLKYPRYRISEKKTSLYISPEPEEEKRSFLTTYKPLLLVLSFITGTTLLAQVPAAFFDGMLWMRHFMAAFFLVFAFFKLLDLQGFADSYSSYDILAAKWRNWALVYAFVELGLGIAYLTHFAPVLTNTVALVVMSISSIGVLQSVVQKRKIRCACLGTGFNLPMSTVTLIEDGAMVIMSGWMLIYHL